MKMYRVYCTPMSLYTWHSGWLHEDWKYLEVPLTVLIDYAAGFTSFEEADQAAKSVKLERYTIFSN